MELDEPKDLKKKEVDMELDHQRSLKQIQNLPTALSWNLEHMDHKKVHTGQPKWNHQKDEHLASEEGKTENSNQFVELSEMSELVSQVLYPRPLIQQEKV